MLQLNLEIDRHFINRPEGEICVFSSQHTYKDLQKHRVKVTNHGNNNKSAQIQQITKFSLAGVIRLLHGCSTTSAPAHDPTFLMVEALSNEPIFNTMVQRGSKPGLNIPAALESSMPQTICGSDPAACDYTLVQSVVPCASKAS